MASMIALLQRVSEASVSIDERIVAGIASGLLVLLAVDRDDSESHAERMVERVLGYRVFSDRHGRMNLSLHDTGGGLLLVPQFTLAADTRKGTRAGFSRAAGPEAGKRLFEYAVEIARGCYSVVHSGVFGANMQVALVNDGPVTFWLQV